MSTTPLESPLSEGGRASARNSTNENSNQNNNQSAQENKQAEEKTQNSLIATPSENRPSYTEKSNQPTPSSVIQGKTSRKDDKTSRKTPQASESEKKRPVWDNQVQFILSTIGLSVGLGNIWRFPYVAYANGGSAFLFPYLFCAVFFALPLIYLEFIVGQYTSGSPAVAFRKYAPAFEGLGWAMSLMSSTVAIFYTLVIAWAGVYMAYVVIGKQSQLTSCANWWNTPRCGTSDQFASCNVSLSLVFNGSMCEINGTKGVPASQEFFYENLIRKSVGFHELGGINWQTLSSLIVVWIVVYLLVVKGVKYMGYASYVTATVPYVIIAIMFIRGVTLEGSSEGISYYLGTPQWDKLLVVKTWYEAVCQLLFSLTIGFGALISLASYSKLNNNCFRDAGIVIIGDTLMSVVGGVAVFSTLGYMAGKMGVSVEEVVAQGPGLVFITYPQALSMMPVPWLWAGLFFIMLLLLGLSSEVALVGVQCTAIYDQFPKTQKKKWLVTLLVCLTYFLLGAVFATGSGWHWFRLYGDFCGTGGACIIVALEAIVIGYFYGFKNYRKDKIAMFGAPANKFTAFFGPTSWYWGLTLITICPAIALGMAVVLIRKFIVEGSFTENVIVDNATVEYTFPVPAMMFGWLLNVGPILAIPILFVINFVHNQHEGKPFREMFRVQKNHLSYARINGKVDQNKDQQTSNVSVKPDKDASSKPSSVVDKPTQKKSEQKSSTLAV